MTEAIQKSRGRGMMRKLLSPIELLIGPLTRENGVTWLKLIAIILVVKWLAIEPFRIPSSSMEPTLFGRGDYLRDDRVAVNKLAFGARIPFTTVPLATWGEPRRWDIVVFRSVEPLPPEAPPLARALHHVWPKILIKRVVGMPGERIHIADGRVYADGRPLELPEDMPPVYYTSKTPGFMPYLPKQVGPTEIHMIPQEDPTRYGVRLEDEYSLVPPDAYLVLGDNSADSLDGRRFGWVPRDHLLGRAFAIWWPLGRHRDLTGFYDLWWGKLLLFGLPAALVLLELVNLFVVRTWKVRGRPVNGLLKHGDRVLIDCRAFGMRLPFMRRRLTAWRSPRRRELVLYRAPRKSEWDGALLLGTVTALPGDPLPGSGDETQGIVPEVTYFIEAVEDAHDPDSRTLGCIPREYLIGSVASIWWPLRRRRSFDPRGMVGVADDGA